MVSIWNNLPLEQKIFYAFFVAIAIGAFLTTFIPDDPEGKI
jgi:hypothetical protein